MYAAIQQRARQIVAQFPRPAFYRDFSEAVSRADRIFTQDSQVRHIHAFVTRHLNDDYGHGLIHAQKVALDAGTLLIAEYTHQGRESSYIRRQAMLVQCAALLHDIKRREKDHARRGAEYARDLLQGHPLSRQEVENISRAIRSHTAHKAHPAIASDAGALIADCLYDADKFRWGPDNFSHTVWAMVSAANLPLERFMAVYPEGLGNIARVRGTFRTRIGRAYGPEFIDLGLVIGRKVYTMIQKEFLNALTS